MMNQRTDEKQFDGIYVGVCACGVTTGAVVASHDGCCRNSDDLAEAIGYMLLGGAQVRRVPNDARFPVTVYGCKCDELEKEG